MSWIKKKIVFAGSILFRGTWPLRKEEFNFLKDLGIAAEEGAPVERAAWSLDLRHPDWGQSSLICFRDYPLPPHSLVDLDPGLTKNEASEIKSCGTALALAMEAGAGHVLRDRKNALRFMRAILAEEGIGGLDHLSGRFWPKPALDLELCHDADLDIESLMTMHLVSDSSADRNAIWLHSHGLGEMGFFDFDILRPSPAVFGEARDVLRAIAFAIVEERFRIGDHAVSFCSGKPAVRATPVGIFKKRAGAQEIALRDDPDGFHETNRAILCDSVGGFFAHFAGGVRSSRMLASLKDEGILIHFSSEATELMALRARATYSLLRTISEETAEFSLRPLVKLRYAIDGAEKEDDAEHLWFEAHQFLEEQIDATLINEPFRIAGMKAGQRALHSIDKLTDWQIRGGPQPITPRSTVLLRSVRENKDALRAAAKELSKNMIS